MALPDPPLAQVCRKLRERLVARYQGDSTQVTLGHPAAAARGSSRRLNLFVYRVEPGGFASGTVPDQPWLVRLHCLITAFGESEGATSATTVDPLAGDTDLRLLGDVLAFFHEHPILDLGAIEVDGGAGSADPSPRAPWEARLQIVFEPLGIDDINHLWATQGDVPYRPSIAYEMSLVPILPRVPGAEPPRVGRIGLETRAAIGDHQDVFGGRIDAPVPGPWSIDPGRDDWAPRIAFVDRGRFVESLGLRSPTSDVPPIEVGLWIVGDGRVLLRWQIWDRERGWRDHPPEIPTMAQSPAFDPETSDPGLATHHRLPLDRPGQALAHVVREATAERAEVRSNPLLVSLYAEEGGDG